MPCWPWALTFHPQIRWLVMLRRSESRRVKPRRLCTTLRINIGRRLRTHVEAAGGCWPVYYIRQFSNIPFLLPERFEASWLAAAARPNPPPSTMLSQRSYSPLTVLRACSTVCLSQSLNCRVCLQSISNGLGAAPRRRMTSVVGAARIEQFQSDEMKRHIGRLMNTIEYTRVLAADGLHDANERAYRPCPASPH
ncbi:hypothetical protein LZ30DRAFT_724583 [Colletotrichum cereale]|nr:hypothetical protein LZ30DRAFT_724583 [Colletotrichum cereale]